MKLYKLCEDYLFKVNNADKKKLLEEASSLDTSAERLTDIINLNVDEHILQAIARNPSINLEGMKKLIQSFPDEIFDNMAFKLELFANKKDGLNLNFLMSEDERYHLARKSNSINVLKILSKDKSDYVRSGVAENETNDVNILHNNLSNDSSANVRGALAFNPYVNKDLMSKLSNDKDEFVRLKLAGNINCDKQILSKLSNDSSERVRYNVAQNTLTPANVLKQMLNDDDFNVVSYATKNLKLRSMN